MNFKARAQAIILCNKLEIYTFKITASSPNESVQKCQWPDFS